MARLPEHIGKYQVVAVIGRGGMGSVYKAHDPHLDRMVAVKVMNDDAEVGSEARARFLREAQSAARLNHSNIITVYELGEERGRIFIVMELLEGEPLSRLIDGVPPLGLPEKLAIMVQICDGLGFAHQRGIVHRDVKPANVIFLENGQVKILDFGIARLISSDLTRSGLLMGTPNYMSPEQARGRKTDARTDIFSAGVVFYELLSGRRPFAGADYFETLEKLRSVEPTWLGELVPSLPDSLSRAVHKAMAKDLGQRHESIDQLRRDLAAVLDEVGGSAAELRDAVSRKLGEVVRLHRKLVATVGAAALDDEKLPIAELAGSDAGLRTLLRKLEAQVERLERFARDVERLEPSVERGVAAVERGDYTVAARELDRVLAEIPMHQRAREHRDRVRHEEDLERTVRAFRSPLPVTSEPLGVPPALAATPTPITPKSPAPVVVRAADDRPAAEVTVRTRPPASPPRAVGTGVRIDETETAAGHRGRWAVAVVGVLAVVGGGAVLFGPLGSPKGGPTLSPPVASTTAPATATETGPAPAPAPTGGSAREPVASQPTPRPASPPPARVAPAPQPPPPQPAPQPPRPPSAAPGARVDTPPSEPPRRPVPAPIRPGPPAASPPLRLGAPPAPPLAREAPGGERPAFRPPRRAPETEPREALRSPAPAPGLRPTARPPKAAPPRPVLTPEQEKVVEDTLTFAQMFQRRADNVRALREYRRVLEIDPTHPEARRGLAAVEQAIKSEPARAGQ